MFQIHFSSHIQSSFDILYYLNFFLVMWWWIIWHLYWDWGHIVGEFDYPDTSKWTDEELGIPPDDEE